MKNHKYNADEYTPDDVQPDPVVAQIDESYWDIAPEPIDYLIESWVDDKRVKGDKDD